VTRPCPKPEVLSQLVDGELTENGAAALRAHVAGCATCAGALEDQRSLVARIAAPVPGVPSQPALAALMRRLDTAEARARRPSSLRRCFVALGAAAAAAATVLLLVAPGRSGERGASAPRGAAVEWTRKLGVELWALEGTPRRLDGGASIGPGTALVASYSNVDGAPAYLLAFAFDARGEVHWLYPAFVDRRTDPEAIRLEPAIVNRALADSVILEDVAPGPLRVVTVVSREPLRVSSVEALPPSERSLDVVRGRWPSARVDELPLRFDPSFPAAEVHP
jgi:anti-sigma factor RsiW